MSASPPGPRAPRPRSWRSARRRFTAEYKQRILAEADAAGDAGGHRRLAAPRGPVLLASGDLAARAAGRHPARA